jgi:hypothetical protein
MMLTWRNKVPSSQCCATVTASGREMGKEEGHGDGGQRVIHIVESVPKIGETKVLPLFPIL